MIIRRHMLGLCFGVLVGGVCSIAAVYPAVASVYGGGAYSNCGYVTVCSSASSPTTTQVQLPSGLQVIVNLQNNQLIPLSGYTITVAPADGHTTSLKQVSFSIDGVTVQSVTPDSDGTVRWFWDPRVHPGTAVTLNITDQNNQSQVQTFSVEVGQIHGSSQIAAVHPNQPASSSAPTGPAGLIESIFTATYKPILYSFPYLLFTLLAINALLLLIQERREVRELRTLQRYVERTSQVIEQKNTFIALTSHYLRTPLTVMLGGLELLEITGRPLQLAQLRTCGMRLREKVETLLEHTDQLSTLPMTNEVEIKVGLRPWRHPAVFLPIVSLGAVALLFNYLAAKSTDLSVGQINWLVQAALFTSIALATFLVFRYLQLGRRDNKRARALLAAQASVTKSQDALIEASVDQLNQDLLVFEQQLEPYRLSVNAVSLMKNGCDRFRHILDRFAISLKLKGSQSSQPFTEVRLGSLFEQAKAVAEGSMVHAAHLQLVNDAVFYIRNPSLLTIVLTTLIDNALAYSNAESSVAISCVREKGIAKIIITDHGKGMPQEALARIFQPFTKLEGAEDFTHEGMGFSLYLDKLIMTYLGGGIALESQLGVGTTVTLTLPLSATSSR